MFNSIILTHYIYYSSNKLTILAFFYIVELLLEVARISTLDISEQISILSTEQLAFSNAVLKFVFLHDKKSSIPARRLSHIAAFKQDRYFAFKLIGNVEYTLGKSVNF